MIDRWWIYSGELFWTSPDRTIKVHLLQGGAQLWRFRVQTPDAEVTFHSDVGMGGTLEVESGERLPLTASQRDDLRAAIARAIPRREFDAIEQYILNRVASAAFERGSLSLKRLRYELHQQHRLDVQTAQARIERLAHRYVQVSGSDYAYATP